METRNNEIQFELRNHPGDPRKPGSVIGYAAVFGKLSHDLGGFHEQLSAFCFTDQSMAGDIMALYNHDSSAVLGRSRAGTLLVAPDTAGLHIEIDLPDTQVARDLWTGIERSDIVGASFGFTVAKDEWTSEPIGPVRTITEIKQLFEVSVVGQAAYPDTSVAQASLRSFTGKTKNTEVDRMVESHRRQRWLRLHT